MLSETIKIYTPYGEYEVSVEYRMNSGFPEDPHREYPEIDTFEITFEDDDDDVRKAQITSFVDDVVLDELLKHLDII